MPIYEYKCRCGHCFEETFSWDEVRDTNTKTAICEHCGNDALKIPSRTGQFQMMTNAQAENMRNSLGFEPKSKREVDQFMRDRNLVKVSKEEYHKLPRREPGSVKDFSDRIADSYGEANHLLRNNPNIAEKVKVINERYRRAYENSDVAKVDN